MSSRSALLWALASSLLGVPAVFALVYELGYGSVFPSNWDLALLGGFILAGAAMIYRLPLSSLGARLAASSAYAVVMTGVLLFAALGVACGNGNCL
ncbi:hypothetical protein [Steroidobacter cummioxidans]|uniref:hypothetical protein n=1 Tax=Steroidobacter cummioxidans TaxID=1803913 RepID=UPI0012901B2D|nr:hypothetical protein [Steroidobacter cummioxidans]